MGEALEARYAELEKNLRAKDDQLRELQQMAQRTARELERKERQVEESNLNNSALTQKVQESENAMAACAQRTQELEVEVRRLAAFRDERERRRRDSDALDRPENAPDPSEFARAVNDVNKGRIPRDQVPVVEASLLSASPPPMVIVICPHWLP